MSNFDRKIEEAELKHSLLKINHSSLDCINSTYGKLSMIKFSGYKKIWDETPNFCFCSFIPICGLPDAIYRFINNNKPEYLEHVMKSLVNSYNYQLEYYQLIICDTLFEIENCSNLFLSLKRKYFSKTSIDISKPMAITITFGDSGENHVGNQIIGQRSNCGFSFQDLVNARIYFESSGVECFLYRLNDLYLSNNLHNSNNHLNVLNNHLNALNEKTESAFLLVIPNGLNLILNEINADSDSFYSEQINLEFDSKALMKGKVCDKAARYNLCFSNFQQDPDYENGKGTIYAWDVLPILNYVRNKLSQIMGPAADNMMAEGNYYYDIEKCGIGYHGDAERRKVIAVRVGLSNTLAFQWYHENQPVGDKFVITLNHGDMYIMSEKAVGYDWKRRTILTLRHAAGCDKFIN